MNECAPDTAMGLPMREAFLLHRRQHGEDALPAFVLDHRRTADGPGLYRLRPLSRLGQGSEKRGLPHAAASCMASGQLCRVRRSAPAR